LAVLAKLLANYADGAIIGVHRPRCALGYRKFQETKSRTREEAIPVLSLDTSSRFVRPVNESKIDLNRVAKRGNLEGYKRDREAGSVKKDIEACILYIFS